MTYIKNVEIKTIAQAKGFVKTKMDEFQITADQKYKVAGIILSTVYFNQFNIHEASTKAYYKMIDNGLIPDRNDNALRHNDRQFATALLYLYGDKKSIVSKDNTLYLTNKGVSELNMIIDKLKNTKPQDTQLAFDLTDGANPYRFIEAAEQEIGIPYTPFQYVMTSIQTGIKKLQDTPLELTDDEQGVLDSLEQKEVTETMVLTPTDVPDQYEVEFITDEKPTPDEFKSEYAPSDEALNALFGESQDTATPIEESSTVNQEVLKDTYLPYFDKARNSDEVAEQAEQFGDTFTQALELFIKNDWITTTEITIGRTVTIYSLTESGKATLYTHAV